VLPKAPALCLWTRPPASGLEALSPCHVSRVHPRFHQPSASPSPQCSRAPYFNPSSGISGWRGIVARNPSPVWPYSASHLCHCFPSRTCTTFRSPFRYFCGYLHVRCGLLITSHTRSVVRPAELDSLPQPLAAGSWWCLPGWSVALISCFPFVLRATAHTDRIQFRQVTVSRLFVYPIKSCAGIELSSSNVDSWGLEWVGARRSSCVTCTLTASPGISLAHLNRP